MEPAKTKPSINQQVGQAESGDLKPEALMDEQKWDAAFEATTDEDLLCLEQAFREDEKREGTTPLGFNGR